MTVRYCKLIAVTVVLLGACTDAESGAPELFSEARDSAGITIVENQAPSPDSRLDWQISAEPEVSIGTLEGEEGYGCSATVLVRPSRWNGSSPPVASSPSVRLSPSSSIGYPSPHPTAAPSSCFLRFSSLSG